MPTLTIDNKTIDVPAGITVLQACELAGLEIPRFCYHERLSIAGNCRMCLVEMEKAPKPIASCAMPVADGMVIKTNTPTVEKARNGVMEFLLVNHPLDCPICDQGGECDLQDQAMAYGRDHSRYEENKRAVPEKNMGPLVKTIMTRCIHCTRCVRFSEEVAGVDAIGAVGRGETMEITTLEQAIASELSANVIDLCPVGALTSRPYAFNARPWELRKTESIDVLDAMGSNIRIDARGNEVLRILPRLHEDINEEWLGDKSRYACDGLKYQRLDRPYIRENGQLRPATWGEALTAVSKAFAAVTPDTITALAGDQVDTETLFLVKQLLASLGSRNAECRIDGMAVEADDRAGWLFNTTFAGIEQADVLLLVGTNPRKEAPLLNARIRKRWLTGKLKVFSIGEQLDLTYEHTVLGKTPDLLDSILRGTHSVADVLRGAANPVLILGQAALSRDDSPAIIGAARELAAKYGVVREGWNGWNVLHTAASRAGALTIGFVPEKGKTMTSLLSGSKVLWLLGADSLKQADVAGKTVIYQGHHGDAGATLADIILPGAAYTEKDALYVNMEGRVQYARQAVMPPGEAREDWKIVRALSEACGKTLPYNTLAGVRTALHAAYPLLAHEDTVPPAAWSIQPRPAGSIAVTPFEYPVRNYYQTDPISRASRTMAECTRVFVAA